MTTRAHARIVSAAALTVMACALVTVPAEAAAYRYWTYWQSPTAQSWEFATQGPGTSVPADGSVEGWSFRVSEESGADDAAPATLPDFDALCGGTAAGSDLKRIGLVVDPGAPELAPAGETAIVPLATCVSIDIDATGYDVLRSVMEVRTENGLVCGLGGYPAGECAPVLDDAEVAEVLARQQALADLEGAPGQDSGTGDAIVVDHGGSDANASAVTSSPAASSGPTASIIVVSILVLGAVLLLLQRRRKDRSDA